MPYRTSDGKTSEECADEYALTRRFCEDGVRGHYWKLGVDFGGIALGPGYPLVNPAGPLSTLKVTKSYAPGMKPAVDNPRYTGKDLRTAIANMVKDGQLDAIFTESLVPNNLTETGGQAPDGLRFASLGARYQVTDLYSDATKTLASPELGKWITNNRDAQLPYGRIGWPSCTFADIQRVAADANWGERQNNIAKKHVIGGTNYIAGGDTWHSILANEKFSKFVARENLGAFNQVSTQAGGPDPATAGFIIDWNSFAYGTIEPDLELFGLLFSLNAAYSPDWKTILNSMSYKPLRGAWAYDWCSGSSGVGYDALKRGAVATILCETEPYSNGLPSVDCVAHCLLLGLTVAEANFLSDQMQSSNHSVYGAPDYAPYRFTNSTGGLLTTGSQKSKQHDILTAFIAAFNYDTLGMVDIFNKFGKQLTAAKNEDPTNTALAKGIAAVNGVAAAFNKYGPDVRAALNEVDAIVETNPIPPPVVNPSVEIILLLNNDPGYLSPPFAFNVGAQYLLMAKVKAESGDLLMTGIFSVAWSVISPEGIVRLTHPNETLLAIGVEVEAIAAGGATIQCEVTLNSDLASGQAPQKFSSTAEVIVA